MRRHIPTDLDSNNVVHLLVRVCGIRFEDLAAETGVSALTLRTSENRRPTPYVTRRLRRFIRDIQPELATSEIGRAVYRRLSELMPVPKPDSLVLRPKLLTPEPKHAMAYMSRQLGISQVRLAALCGVSNNLVGKMIAGNRRALSYNHDAIRMGARKVLRILRRDYPKEVYHVKQLERLIR